MVHNPLVWCGGCDHVAKILAGTEERQEQGFLRVHAVFGLVEDHAACMVGDLIGDLKSAALA